MKLKRRRKVILALVAGAVVLTAGPALAFHVAGHTTDVAGVEKAIGVARSTNPAFTTSQAYVTLDGSGVSFSVPSSTTDLIVARFTAESQCQGGAAGNWCTVRVVVRNNSTGTLVEMFPNSGTDLAFDSVGSANDFWESNAIERSIKLGGGNYTAFVQYRTTSSSTSHRLDDWHFAVERNE